MSTFRSALLLAGLCACGAPSEPGSNQGPPTGLPPDPTEPRPGSAEAELTEEELAWARELAPEEWPAPPPDPSNAWADDDAAAALGQRIFFDPRFSGPLLDADNDGSEAALGHQGDTGKVSCAGCHIPEWGFVDTRSRNQQISLGSEWVLRRTPSLLDVAQMPLFMWDGRHDTLYNQPFGALESRAEMNSSRLFVAQQVFALYRAEYESVFGPLPPLDDPARFPPLTPETAGCYRPSDDGPLQCVGRPGDGSVFDSMDPADQDAVTRVMVNVGKALAAYQRRLSCGPGRFDAWVHGEDDALSQEEIRGFKLFVGKGNCVHCHQGPFFSDGGFHNVGLEPKVVAAVFINVNDPGAAEGLEAALRDPLNVNGIYSDGADDRLPTEVPSSMLGAFKTPMLRCRSEQPSFMHTGHMRSLEEVVAFFARGGDRFGFMGTSELADAEGNPIDLGLTQEEQAALVAFLRTLEGPGPDASLLQPIPN